MVWNACVLEIYEEHMSACRRLVCRLAVGCLVLTMPSKLFRTAWYLSGVRLVGLMLPAPP